MNSLPKDWTAKMTAKRRRAYDSMLEWTGIIFYSFSLPSFCVSRLHFLFQFCMYAEDSWRKRLYRTSCIRNFRVPHSGSPRLPHIAAGLRGRFSCVNGIAIEERRRNGERRALKSGHDSSVACRLRFRSCYCKVGTEESMANRRVLGVPWLKSESSFESIVLKVSVPWF